MILATKKGMIDIVKLLLDHGADVKTNDKVIIIMMIKLIVTIILIINISFYNLR